MFLPGLSSIFLLHGLMFKVKKTCPNRNSEQGPLKRPRRDEEQDQVCFSAQSSTFV